jgi:hypothetical protein
VRRHPTGDSSVIILDGLADARCRHIDIRASLVLESLSLIEGHSGAVYLMCVN